MSVRRLALVLVLLGPSIAVATPMRGAAQEGRQGPSVDVVVHNRAGMDTHVYVLQEGHMVPLGFVDAGADATLTVPSSAIQSGAIRLVADPLGSTDWYTSDPVMVGSSHEVDFTINRDLDRSRVTAGE